MSVSRIEVSKRALLQNAQTFRAVISKKTKLLVVVKANAYGHGLELVAKTVESKADWFGVDNFEEARLLRANGIKKPILVLGYVPTEELSELVRLSVSFVVYRSDVLEEIARKTRKVGKEARIHLKIETGTNRQGVGVSDLVKVATEIKKHKEVILEGAYTHFANIEDTTDPSFAIAQLEKFNAALGVLTKNGLVPEIAHTAATAAILLYPQTHFNMVRVGIGLYGLWPSLSVRRAMSSKVKLVPVLSWKTDVVQVKDVLKDESVGYGRTWYAIRPSTIAILPVGYSDGYDRGLSNKQSLFSQTRIKGRVLIRGHFAPVVGRVAMNIMMVDATDISGVRAGDEAVLIGRQGENEITVEELAKLLGTINYEVVARLNPAIQRVLVE